MLTKMLVGIGTFLLIPMLCAAQSQQQRQPEPSWNARPTVEIIGSLGVGHLFRFEDRGFGTQMNAGAGVEVTIWRGLRAGAEFNRMFGLEPGQARCGAISPGPEEPAFPCSGSAREGVSAASAASFTAGYYFGDGPIQPFVLGGMSILRTQEYGATYIVHDDYVEIRENLSKDTGVGITLGAGLRARLSRRLSIRPEFRFSDGTALSSGNLSQFRVSVGIGYSW